MSICLVSNRIIKLHGGNIGVYSEGVGHGCTFFIDLPISEFRRPSITVINEQHHAAHSSSEFHNSSRSESFSTALSNAPSYDFSQKSTGPSLSVHKGGIRSSTLATMGMYPISVVIEEDAAAEMASPTMSPQRTAMPSVPPLNKAGFDDSDLVMCSKGSVDFGEAAPLPHPAPLTEGSVTTLRTNSGLGLGLNPTISSSFLLKKPSFLGSNSTSSRYHPGSGSTGSTPTSKRASLVNSHVNLYEKRILIVDDARTNRKLVNRLLRDHIRTRDEAGNGREAVDMVRQAMIQAATEPLVDESVAVGSYDIVLLDYFMPELTGPQAAHAMRKELGYAGIIVGITGNGNPEDVKDFEDQGVDAVLVKPLDATYFIALLYGKTIR